MAPGDEYWVETPWWVRLWRAIKPPPPVNTGKPPKTPQQRFLLRLIVAIVAVVAMAGFAFYYFASVPARAEARFNQGMRLLGAGKSAEAVEEFTRAIDIAGGNATFYLQRGNARQVMGRNDEALEDFEQAALLDPSLADALTARGTIYLIKGETARAFDEFSKSIQVRPSVNAYYQRGQLQAQRGEHQKAILDYDEAIALQRDAPYVYRARGESKRAIADIAGFEQDRNTALSLETRR